MKKYYILNNNTVDRDDIEKLSIDEIKKLYGDDYLGEYIVDEADDVDELIDITKELVRDFYEAESIFGDPVEDLFKYIPKDVKVLERILASYNYTLKKE